MSTSLRDRMEAEKQRAQATAPCHRFKQADGSRYPAFRPDGLVYQKQLREILGIAKITLLRWQKLGWITPEGKEGHCTLYRVPTPERVLEIRTMAAERASEGAKRGRQSQMAQGAHLDRAKNGREAKTRQAQERAAQGLVNKRSLARLMGTHCAMLNIWIEQGIITPALVSPSGKQMWFTEPDGAAIKRIKSAGRAATVKPVAAKVEPTPEIAPVVAKVEPVVVEHKPTPVKPVAPKPAPEKKTPGYVSHAEATLLGRSEARFQTVLGFNLLQHPELGFRAAVVSEKAEQGWRYYERHFINGYGQWQVKAQKPLTGEIVL